MKLTDLIDDCIENSSTLKAAKNKLFRRLKEMDEHSTVYPKDGQEYVEVSSYVVARSYRRKGNVGKHIRRKALYKSPQQLRLMQGGKR